MERDIRWRVPTWCFILVDLVVGTIALSALFTRPHSAGALSQASFPSQFQPQPYFGTLNQQQQPADSYYNFMPTAPTLYAQVCRREADQLLTLPCILRLSQHKRTNRATLHRICSWSRTPTMPRPFTISSASRSAMALGLLFLLCYTFLN